MAVSFVGAGAIAATSGAVIPVPAGVQYGDFLVCVIATSDTYGGWVSPTYQPQEGPAVWSRIGSEHPFWMDLGAGQGVWQSAASYFGAFAPSSGTVQATLPAFGESIGGGLFSTRAHRGVMLAFRGCGGVGNIGIRSVATQSAALIGAFWYLTDAESAIGRGMPTDLTQQLVAEMSAPGKGGSFRLWFDLPNNGVAGTSQTANLPSSVTWRCMELLPQADPGVPLVRSPEAGLQVGASAPLPVMVEHVPVVAGGFPSAAKVRVSTDSGATWRYWTGAALSTSESSFTTPAATDGLCRFDFPSGTFAAGTSVVMQAATREATDGRWSPWSLSRPFAVVASPTLTVSVSSPAGVLTPTVSWTPTLVGAQMSYRVQILSGAAVFWDSGDVLSSDRQLVLPRLEWINGGSYTARVQVAQTGGARSGWGTASFTVSWTVPAAPSIGVSDAGDGVLVVVSTAAGNVVEVERLDSAVWMLSWSGVAPAAGVSFVDVLALASTPTKWRARAAVSPSAPWSAWVESPATTTTSTHSWIVDATDLTVRFPGRLRSDKSRGRGPGPLVEWGSGDSSPMVTYGTPRRQTGTWVAQARNRAEADALRGYLALGRTFYLRVPPDGKGDPGEVIKAVRISEVGDERLVEGPHPYRLLTFGWAETS